MRTRLICHAKALSILFQGTQTLKWTLFLALCPNTPNDILRQWDFKKFPTSPVFLATFQATCNLLAWALTRLLKEKWVGFRLDTSSFTGFRFFCKKVGPLIAHSPAGISCIAEPFQTIFISLSTNQCIPSLSVFTTLSRFLATLEFDTLKANLVSAQINETLRLFSGSWWSGLRLNSCC